MIPTPVCDSIKAFAKKNKVTKVCLSYAKYTQLAMEWHEHFKVYKVHLDLSVPQEDRWDGIFARIDNVDLYYDGGQVEEMRPWPTTKSSSKRSKP